MPDNKQLQARTVVQEGVVLGDWKDAISALGVSDDGRSPPREREEGRGYRGERKPPGGGGGGGRDGDDPRRDRSPKRPAKSPERPKKLRASLVVPQKERKRRPGGDPDPSDDDDDGKGRGGGRRGRSRSRRKRSRRGRKNSRSDSRSSTRDSDEDFYGREARKFASLVEKAKKRPGKLLRSGLTEMGRYLQGRLGEAGELEGSWRDQKVKAYLAQILFTQHSPQSVGVRNSRELLTLAEGIDLLMSEEFAALGDLLMQRFKALESSLSDGWSVARHQELIRADQATVTTPQERAFAARAALQQSRLEEAVRKKKASG